MKEQGRFVFKSSMFTTPCAAGQVGRSLTFVWKKLRLFNDLRHFELVLTGCFAENSLRYYYVIMYTYLEITVGTGANQLFRVRPNLRLGSGNCEVQLQDPTLAVLHSQVMLDSEDRLVLVCTNAVYEIVVNGRSVKKVVLEDGLNMKVGSSTIRVIISAKPVPGARDPLKPQVDQGITFKGTINDTTNLGHRSRATEPESTKKFLLQELNKMLESAKRGENQKSAIQLFKLPVRLKIERGPQADDEFFLSWGPREFGPLAMEFPIEYPPFPGILFSLTPGDTGDIIFSTKHPDFARVCGHTEQTCVIDDGDRIEAGNSTILVEYLRDANDHNKN